MLNLYSSDDEIRKFFKLPNINIYSIKDNYIPKIGDRYIIKDGLYFFCCLYESRWRSLRFNESGPAIIKFYDYDKGCVERIIYSQKLNCFRHRYDGPADIYYFMDGSIKSENYFLNDKLHNSLGPARRFKRLPGSFWNNYFYFNDVRIDLDTFIKSVERKLDWSKEK